MLQICWAINQGSPSRNFDSKIFWNPNKWCDFNINMCKAMSMNNNIDWLSIIHYWKQFILTFHILKCRGIWFLFCWTKNWLGSFRSVTSKETCISDRESLIIDLKGGRHRFPTKFIFILGAENWADGFYATVSTSYSFMTVEWKIRTFLEVD